jgi:hypothetical protein
MNEMERFLDQVCCGVAGSPELRRHLRKELREHLTEEIESNVAAGLSREEAVDKAITECGDPVMIRDGLQAVHGRRLMSLLIEKSMNWRETTMKTGWKWGFVAQVTLALTITVELFFVAVAVVYVLPGIFGWHSDLATPTFAYLDTIKWLAGWLYMQFLWIPCLLLLLAGWGLFEWKYRSENKSIIRLASLSVSSVVMLVVLAIVWVPMAIDLSMLPGQVYDLQANPTPQQAERIVLPGIAEADAAFQELRAAIERDDWPAVNLAARQLSDTYHSLGDVSTGVIVLAGETRRYNLGEIRALINQMTESSRNIHHRLLMYEHSQSKAAVDLKAKVPTYFGQLEKSYSKLASKSDLFAADGGERQVPGTGVLHPSGR